MAQGSDRERYSRHEVRLAMSIIIPLLVAFIGAFVYVASKNNGKVAELGRIAYACGLLVTVFEASNHVVSFLAK
jgi:hypothetical protein